MLVYWGEAGWVDAGTWMVMVLSVTVDWARARGIRHRTKGRDGRSFIVKFVSDQA